MNSHLLRFGTFGTEGSERTGERLVTLGGCSPEGVTNAVAGEERRDTMLLNIAIAALMMIVTTGIHAGGMMLTRRAIAPGAGRLRHRLQQTRIYWVGGAVLLVFLVSLVEVSVWAATYLALDASQGFERTLYFSMVTVTTLGYGDIVLDERWHLLTSFERPMVSLCSVGRLLSWLPPFNASTSAKNPTAITT